MNDSVDPNGNGYVDPREDARIHFLISEILEHVSNRMKILVGRDKLSLQQEFIEWLAMTDHEDIEVDFMDFYAS